MIAAEQTQAVIDRKGGGWHLLWWAVRSQGYGVPAGVAGGVAWMVAAASVPTVLSRAIDQGLVAGNGRRLAFWIAVLVGLGIMEAGAGAVRHRFAVRNGQGTAAAVRERLLHHLHRLDAPFYDRWPSGEILSRSFSDATWVGLFVDILAHTSGYLAAVAIVAVFLVLIDPLLALITLVPLLPIAVAAWRYSARFRERSHELQQELARASALAEDTIGGIRTLKGLRAEDTQRERYGHQTALIRDRGLAIARLDALFQPVMEVLPAMGLLIVVWLGSRFALSGRITVGELIAFYAYVVLLSTPLRVLGIRIGTVQRSLAAAERISEILDIEPEVATPDHPVPLPPAGPGQPRRGAVRFEAVRFGYGRGGSPVLDDLNLSVPAGSTVAIVGPTGAGKSTIARVLSRGYDVTAGRVSLDGVDVRDLSLSELHRAVVVVSERPFLFADTVRANLSLGKPNADMEAIERAARLAGAHEFIAGLPDGYDTVLEERGYSLSGGQRQRLALARAILAEPRVLVLDDATSAMDAETEREVRAGLATALSGRTALIITRRPATIALADQAVLIEHGRVSATGTPDELMLRSETFRDLMLGDSAPAVGAAQ